MCLEGIKIAQEKQHRSDETNWKVELLNIAKQQNNAQDAQKWAKALMFDGKYIRMEFYEELKNTYAETEWPNKCEQIIADINNADDRIGASRNLVLPEIFLREHLWDRLITLVSQNTELTFVDHYAPFLQDQFPHEILDAYTQAIKIASQKVGRNAYKNIARYLAKMLTIQGGKEITAQLIHYLLNQYPTRKAMKEVFQTSFPEILSADSPKSPPSKPNMRLL